MSLKILFISPSYQPAVQYGGTTVVISKLAETLVECGAEVWVYTTTANGDTELNVRPDEETELNGVKVVYFRRITKDHSHFSPAMLFKLRKKAKDFDVVHLHSWWNLFNLCAAFLLYWLKKPYIVSPHGMLSAYTFQQSSKIKHLLHFLIGKRLLAYATLHGTSRQEIQEIKEIIPKPKYFYVSNLVEIPTIEPQQYIADEIVTIGFLSRVEKKKNLELLFEVLAKLDSNIHLKIAGSGDESYIQSLKSKSSQLNLGNRISWLGWLNQRKFNFLQTVDLFVLPSHNENFAVVVLESLLCGTPVLLSTKVGLADWVLEHELGWVFDGSKEDLERQITTAIRATEKRKWIRAHSPLLVKKHFDPKTLGKNYLSHYHQLIKSHGKL